LAIFLFYIRKEFYQWEAAQLEEYLEKYKELYDLSKEVLNEEHNRFTWIDDKAAKYLSALTLVAAVAGFFGKWLIVSLIPPKTEIEWVLFIVGATLFIMMFVSWFLLLDVLRVQRNITMPLDDETISFFDDNELVNIYYNLARGNKDALEENEKITNIKAKWLKYGYISMCLSVVLLGLFVVVFVLHSWNETNKMKGDIAMAEDAKQNATSQGGDGKPKVIKPNPAIKPPKYRVVTEGFDPSKIKDKKK
jgi:hypothetical protein